MTIKHTISKIENFLTKEEFSHICSLIEGADFSWILQTSLPKVSKLQYGFLQSMVNLDHPFYIELCNKVSDSFDLHNYTCKQAYYNGQWFSRDGSFHSDYGKKTVLIYLSPWEDNWGGFTHFIPDGEHVIIPPITNSAVCFDADIPHKAYAFSEQFAPMRITLAFKYYDKT